MDTTQKPTTPNQPYKHLQCQMFSTYNLGHFLRSQNTLIFILGVIGVVTIDLDLRYEISIILKSPLRNKYSFLDVLATSALVSIIKQRYTSLRKFC